MTAKKNIDAIIKIIDTITSEEKVSNAAHFSLIARTIYQAIQKKHDDNVSIATATEIIRFSWQALTQRKEKHSIHFQDVQLDGKASTVVVVSQEDQPFLVDTIRIALANQSLAIQQLYNIAEIEIVRDEHGNVVPYAGNQFISEKECVVQFVVNRISEQEKNTLFKTLSEVLEKVDYAVDDWQKMQGLLDEVVETWHYIANPSEHEKLVEITRYLGWLRNYFTFLGSWSYSISNDTKLGMQKLKKDAKAGLGILRHDNNTQLLMDASRDVVLDLSSPVLEEKLFCLTKSSLKCNIHRDVFTDLLILCIYDHNGQVIGQVRFSGLLSSEAYDADPSTIPWIGKKIDHVVEQSKISSRYSTKTLTHILKNIPTDEIFQSSVEELRRSAMLQLAIKGLNETRVIMRLDRLQVFYTMIIVMPKDNYNVKVVARIVKAMSKAFGAHHIDWVSNFSDNSLINIYFTIEAVKKDLANKAFIAEFENRIKQIATPWWDSVMSALETRREDVSFKIISAYKDVFSAKYQSKYSGDEVLDDVIAIEKLKDMTEGEIFIDVRCLPEQKNRRTWSLKIFQVNQEVSLSQILPCLESLGLSVLRENSVAVNDVYSDALTYTISDLHVQPHTDEVQLTPSRIKHMTSCIQAVCHEQTHNDMLNQLITTADIAFEQVDIVRAMIYYAKQTNFALSGEYMQHTLVKYPEMTAKVVSFFVQKFSKKYTEDALTQKVAALERDFESVSSINEDRVFRRLLQTIVATMRTNMSIPGRQVLVFKIMPASIPEMPQPVPLIETFVFSHRVVGTHLRMSRVARGGIRWSNRLEDYRTEVLGLMHAQQLKNAVIVPDGAKGVFVPKHLEVGASREETQAEGLACYRLFIGSLLSLADNYDDNHKVVKPEHVICYDEDDAYFVVAADKGTATFSDYANEIAHKRHFWLHDAFASGGKHGYDHKKIAITAKGAWQSVRWHFLKLGIDPSRDSFTVVGIGDMSGDVFGNGMLLSKHICLQAAFDHRHIFLDPKPCKKSSYQERKRLFKLAGSSWGDYKQELLSEGGGVFSRTEKYIPLSPQVREWLGLECKRLSPCDLIQHLLCARVDLIWNGGIGTYVRASTEADADVRDHVNDSCRVEAKALQASVVVEGGNLGLTQLARIEFALNGGLVNTDFIDNVGGVSCSDHEVNIKIALERVRKETGMSEDERNAVLADVEGDVESMILNSIYLQNFAISVGELQVDSKLDIYIRYIDFLVKKGISNPEVDKLPTRKMVMSRQTGGKFLVRSELAILYSHTKTLLVRSLLEGELVDDPYCLLYLYHAFPKALADKYSTSLVKHVLRREIIATQISDICINDMGLSYIRQMQDETRCSEEMAVRAYFICLEVFQLRPVLNFIYDELHKIEASVSAEVLRKLRILLRKAASWMINHISFDDQRPIMQVAEIFSVPVDILMQSIQQYLDEDALLKATSMRDKIVAHGATEAIANVIAYASHGDALLNIVWAMRETTGRVERFAELYYKLGDLWSMKWLREQIEAAPDETIWAQIARSAALKDLDDYQRSIVKAVFTIKKGIGRAGFEELQKVVDKRYGHVLDEWLRVVKQMQSLAQVDFAVFSVALLRLSRLVEVMNQDLAATMA